MKRLLDPRGRRPAVCVRTLQVFGRRTSPRKAVSRSLSEVRQLGLCDRCGHPRADTCVFARWVAPGCRRGVGDFQSWSKGVVIARAFGQSPARRRTRPLPNLIRIRRPDGNLPVTASKHAALRSSAARGRVCDAVACRSPEQNRTSTRLSPAPALYRFPSATATTCTEAARMRDSRRRRVPAVPSGRLSLCLGGRFDPGTRPRPGRLVAGKAAKTGVNRRQPPCRSTSKTPAQCENARTSEN